MTISETIAVTGATGQLGRLVIAELRRIAPEAHVTALVRDEAGAGDFAAHGVELRTADYEQPATLAAALAGAGEVLLISSNAVGRRVPQHKNVIAAAKAAGVRLLAYTSILRADTTPLALAAEHRETETLIRASGIAFALLRNGWYTENYTASAAAAIQHGAVIGTTGSGRISAAARADYAAAAAAVLTHRENQAGKTYELAGDIAFTRADYAAELARQSGKSVVYKNLSEAGYKAALEAVGVPSAFAEIYAESDAKAAHGALYDDGRQLSGLIGRPTTSLAQSVAAALAG